MPAKRSRATALRAISTNGSTLRPHSFGTEPSPVSAGRRRAARSTKQTGGANQYVCGIERNQNGRYNVRIRALLGAEGRGGWTLAVYFLASSFNAAMKKLEESLQHLQKNEEKLRFWAVERTDDPNLAGDLLEGFGLWLDRRQQFPRKAAELAVTRGRPVAASMLAGARRILAESLAQERPAGSHALASD